jgi:hypothetical protein
MWRIANRFNSPVKITSLLILCPLIRAGSIEGINKTKHFGNSPLFQVSVLPNVVGIVLVVGS